MSKRKRKPLTRSENMARIRGKDTKPEIYLRKLLWHDGFRYRTNYKGLPGRPDIYLSTHRTVLFINGCFWHGHEGCRYATMPKSNHEFWLNKITTNRERDIRDHLALRTAGYDVIVVWECTIRDMVKNPYKKHEMLENLEGLIREEAAGRYFEF